MLPPQPRFRPTITAASSSTPDCILAEPDYTRDPLVGLVPVDPVTKKRDRILGRSSDHDPVPRNWTN
jgi:hypothetical protein